MLYQVNDRVFSSLADANAYARKVNAIVKAVFQ